MIRLFDSGHHHLRCLEIQRGLRPVRSPRMWFDELADHWLELIARLARAGRGLWSRLVMTQANRVGGLVTRP